MAARYLDLLSDADLRLLAEASDTVEPDRAARWFRLAPQELDTALAEERTYEHLFGRTSAPTGIITASPTLLFAVLIHRAAAEIADAPYISERVGGRQLVPVFDSVTLAEFAASAEHRVFLVELLGSYTKVVSGPTLVRQDGRWRRRRFSEMSPTQLAGLLDTVEEAERPGVYRRLGDLALFVTGIFPDHAAQQPIGPVELTRLLRSLPPSERSDVLANEPESVFGRGTTAAVLGGFGPRWYRVASELTPLPTVARPLSEMAGSFDHARRFLTFLTDRHLFDTRSWFPFSWN
ncbi:MAG: hypothetical protein KDB21_08590 [Acidimicrobiales bacterium]|nr:hypothetical protein [Acidimicrobiales bacterium]